jgi:antirestriction protein ArdC
VKIADLYRAVTDNIIKSLEAGTAPWVRPWTVKGVSGVMPTNYASKRAYSGINICILWDAQICNAWTSPLWLTFKQAAAIGVNVRKGEKGTPIVYTNKIVVKNDDDDTRLIPFLKVFYVFNISQLEGLPEEAPKEVLKPDDRVQSFITATKAEIRHGGDRACYVPSKDCIVLPNAPAFDTYEHYQATALHELIHFSGHPSRLNRDLKVRFGTCAYAAEELIAELGAAFLCAHLGIKGELRHAEYLANWLELLKEDDRAIFTAASKASVAADYLRSFSDAVQ